MMWTKNVWILFFLTRLDLVKAQTCQNAVQYNKCSTNLACGCFSLAATDNSGICGYLYPTCSEMVSCARDNQTCYAPGHICVQHPRCFRSSICYPLSMASPILCPSPTPITTPSPQTNDGICASATWNRNGLIRAGGNGPGEALNQFGNIIQSLYVDDESAIYVADTYNDRILKWTPGELNGRLVAGGNGNGDANNQFNYVESVVVSKNGTMFICDRLNKRIQKWLKDDTKGETIVANILCGGMALDIEGSLYIAIDQEERVLKWPANQTVAGGNGQGEALNQLSNPLDIFVDLNHSVFVLDYSNNRVMKWTVGANEGVIVAGGNRQGNHTNQLDQPTSVIVDHMGTVYVTEIGNNRVVRWLKDAYDGSIIIGGRGVGNASDQLSRPNSLAFDRQGNLYVADSANHRIQMYTIDKSSCSLNK